MHTTKSYYHRAMLTLSDFAKPTINIIFCSAYCCSPDFQRCIIYEPFLFPRRHNILFWGSAVCSFEQDTIAQAFAGKFKHQKNKDTIFKVVPDADIPSPRPSEVRPLLCIIIIIYIYIYIVKRLRRVFGLTRCLPDSVMHA